MEPSLGKRFMIRLGGVLAEHSHPCGWLPDMAKPFKWTFTGKLFTA